jgi:uncharacterized protein (TIGR02246 family)
MTALTSEPVLNLHDATALRQRVADLESAQRSEDGEGFLALFDPDAVWVTGGGVRLVGRNAIGEFTRRVLPGGMADGSVRYEVAELRLLATDIALTSVDQEYLTTDGRPLEPPQRGRPSYVWRREADESWRIVVGQNTGVVDA